jgi:hypothetical protein
MMDACQPSKNGGDEVRHLTRAFAVGALRRGKEIEQFLGGIQRNGRDGIRWLTLSPSNAGIRVSLHEVDDIGTDDFWDVTEFPPLDDDEYIGEGQTIAVVATPDDALDLAARDLGARPDRWVNQAVVCSEYGDYRSTRSTQGPASNP